MKSIKVLAIFLITILFLACAADSGSGGSSHNLDNLQIVTLASKDATSTPIIAAKDKSNSDMLVVLGDTNASGDVTNVNGVMLSDANGNSMKISIDNTGLPTRVELKDDFYYTLSNYQGNTAFMSVYDASDNVLFSDRITFANGDIAKLQSFFTTSGQNTQNLNSPQNFQLPSIKRFSDPAFLLSLGSTVTNILACSVSIATAVASAGVAIPLAILGCGSYFFSVLSTSNPDSITLNAISATLDGLGCATVLLTKNITDLISCVALALDAGAFIVKYVFTGNPDLQVFAVRQFDGRARVFSGDEITLLTSTRNIDSGASEPTTLGLYLSEDGNRNGDDTHLDDIATIRELAGQDSDNNEIAAQNQRYSFSAPPTPGVYYYRVCAITVSGEKETENNCSDRIRIEVNNDSDLVVSAFTSGNYFVTDYAFSLSTVISNIGASSSAASNVRFYGSHDRNISPRDTQIGEAQPLDSLAAGSLLENNAQLVITPNTPGTYYYGACVDRVDSEYSTSNNCSLGVEVTVSVANLAYGANWTRATRSAAWSDRVLYSSVVYNDKIWVLGGADYDNYALNDFKNDVWFSADGVTWTRATSSAAWSARALHSSVVYNNKLWVLGGTSSRYFSDATNDVWFSADGVTWTQATSSAAWSARVGHSSVVYNNKLWVLGGVDNKRFKNDVWFSENGSTWTRATSNAAWSTRALHTSVVYNNKLWVLGGGAQYFFSSDWYSKNDVWFSADGATWTQATSDAAWSRFLHSSVVYDDKMWVLGGRDLNSNINIGYKNDLWFSTDGITWTQATSSAAWSARAGHSSVVYNNKLWVLGGVDNTGYLDAKNDVWYLD